MSEELFFVKVGAEGNPDRPQFQEFAGYNFVGPFTQDEAKKFVADCQAVWDRQGPTRFVYGKPTAVIEPLVSWSAERAARNWFLLGTV